jgi:nucleoside-diphosphate-sugar epimerase
MHLLIFGLGYTGIAIARQAARAGHRVTVTSRDPGAAAHPADGAAVIAFADAAQAIGSATHVVSTAPPASDGGHDAADTAVDPVLAVHAAALRASPTLQWIGYVSTTGVYGDRGGGWVDETTPPAPGQERSRRRLAAEQAWTGLRDDVAVDLFRTAGIYGPGRSAIDDLRAGRARRIVKPGHAFGRVHVDDIAGAILAAASRPPPPGVRVLHLSDDLPASNAEVVEEAARLLGVAPPPLVTYDELAPRMNEMARSFWEENRRVASRLTQAWLGRDWLYPTYREGLRAILAATGQ